MKTTHLMLMLSILSANIVRTAQNDEGSLSEPALYGASLAGASAAPGFSQWFSSFQRPSWLSAEGLGRGLAYAGGLAESAPGYLGLTPERVTGWVGSTPEQAMQYGQSIPVISYLLNNPRTRQQALAAALIGIPAAYYGYRKWRGTPATQQQPPAQQIPTYSPAQQTPSYWYYPRTWQMPSLTSPLYYLP